MGQKHSAASPPSASASVASIPAPGGKTPPNAGQPSHPGQPGQGKKKRRGWLRLGVRALCVCALLCAAVLAGALTALRHESVQGWLTEKINASMEAAPESGAASAGVRARITHLSGPLPFGFSLGVELYDSAGLWMRLPACSVQWDWRSLPSTLHIGFVRVHDAHLLRLPLLPDAPSPAPTQPLTEAALRTLLGDALRSLADLPGWLPQIRLEELTIANARLPQSLLGAEAAAATRGEASPPAGVASTDVLDAQLDAGLKLAAGNNGAHANLAVSLAGAGSRPLHLAGAVTDGLEAKARFAVVPTRAGKMLGLDATAELISTLRMPSGPDAEGASPKQPVKASSEISDPGSASHLPAKSSSTESSSAENLPAETGVVAALLHAGASAEARLAASLTAPSGGGAAAGGKVALESLRIEAGPLHIAGHARWDAHGLDSWLDGPLDVEIQTSLGQKSSPDKAAPVQDATSLPAGAAGLLPERAQLQIQIKGPLQAPNVQTALNCPAWNAGGHALSEVSLRLESTPIEWVRVLVGAAGNADDASADSAPAEDMTVRMQASATVDKHPQHFGATLFARQVREGEHALLLVGLRDLQCELLGVAGSGQLSAVLPLPPLAAGMPRMDGKVDVRVADWQALSVMLPGARLDGEAALSFELQSQLAEAAAAASAANPQNAAHPVQGQQNQTRAAYAQQATLRWHVPRLAYSAGKNPATDVRGLEGEAVLTDAFGKGQLAVRLDLAEARSGAMRLWAKLRAQGSVLGPLDASLETGGFAVARCVARWQPGLLELRRLDIDLPSQKLGLRAAAGATMRYGTGKLALSGLDVAMKPSGRLRARADLSEEKLDMRLTLERLSLAPWRGLIPAMPKGDVEAGVRLTGSPAQPGGDMRVDVRGLVVPGVPLKPMNFALSGKLEHNKAGGGALTLRLAPDQATVAALGGTECRVEARLPMLFGADGLPRPHMQGPLRAAVRWNGAVAPLWSLLPVADQRLAGRLALSLDVGGTLDAPAPKGFVRMDDARYENLIYGVLLSGINLRLDLEEGRGGARGLARLKFSAADGQGGTARITGQSRLDGSMLNFKATADHLRPLRRRDVRVELSAQAAVTGSASAPEVRGTLTVDQGLVQLNKLEVVGSITTLPISEISPAWVDAGGDSPAPAGDQGKKTAPARSGGATGAVASTAASTPSTAQPAPAPGGSGGLLDLRIVIPGRFIVEGFGLTSEWRADMYVGGTPAAPLISGQLEAAKGSLDILGKNFKLARGAVTFGGGDVSNPLLDIMLSSQTPALTANISIVGTVRKMQLILSSDPELPRDEILAQILFGKSTNELGRLENLRLAAAVAQLAGFGTGSGGGVLDSARQALGVDVLRFNPGSAGAGGAAQSGQSDESMAAGSTLETGKYLTEDIYVGVQQGAKQGSTAFVIQLELTPKANLELRTEQQSTRGGLTWKYNY